MPGASAGSGICHRSSPCFPAREVRLVDATEATMSDDQCDEKTENHKRKEICERFLRETAHLGSDGQLRVLKVIKDAVESKRKREATHAYPPIEPEQIDIHGEPPPDSVISTYTPPAPYNVDSDDR